MVIAVLEREDKGREVLGDKRAEYIADLSWG